MKASLPILISAVALCACSKTQPEPVSSSAAESTTSTAASTVAVAAAAAPKASAGPASVLHPELLDPSKATAKAPDTFKAKFTTTKGDLVIQVHRAWAPNGADRFYNLVKMGFFDDTRFFRAVDGFMVQFGISGDPSVAKKWQEQSIPDDPPVKQSNARGFVTFAQRGTPNSRATQVFINYGDNSRLDATFIPFGQVVQSLEVADSLYKGYGEGAPMGAGPDQGLIQAQGNAYLDAKFPKLDAIKHAEIIP
jgi:cyclophilin family peptidyl-prolyl cis-trans isomerase